MSNPFTDTILCNDNRLIAWVWYHPVHILCMDTRQDAGSWCTRAGQGTPSSLPAPAPASEVRGGCVSLSPFPRLLSSTLPKFQKVKKEKSHSIQVEGISWSCGFFYKKKPLGGCLEPIDAPDIAWRRPRLTG